MKEIIEVRQYIDELIRRTLQGTIQWQKRSTSAYSWLKKVGEQTLQVSIQRARSVRVRQFYILNIIELPGTSLLTVDSSKIVCLTNNFKVFLRRLKLLHLKRD